MSRQFKVGDRVRYSGAWLRSVHAYSGPLGFARGKITYLQQVGPLTLAGIIWDQDPEGEELPGKVNIKNLEHIPHF